MTATELVSPREGSGEPYESDLRSGFLSNLFRAGGLGAVRNAKRGVREKFSGAFANSPLTGVPFILRTPPLAAIELANCEVFRHDVYDLTLHVLPDPKERVSPPEAIS